MEVSCLFQSELEAKLFNVLWASSLKYIKPLKPIRPPGWAVLAEVRMRVGGNIAG
jgi:hypothetical protein